MNKKLLLTGLISLCSIGVANAVCTPPTTLKCDCAHPIINSEGKLACGTSYCGDKKCMPNGSCCETEKYCEVGSSKYCCSEGQTCDTTSGCVEGKADIETLCAKASGTIIEAKNGSKYCRSSTEEINRDTAKEWCEYYGMTMPSITEMCPSWDGIYGDEKCSELSGVGISGGCVKFWSSTEDGGKGINVMLLSGYVSIDSLDETVGFCAYCH